MSQKRPLKNKYMFLSLFPLPLALRVCVSVSHRIMPFSLAFYVLQLQHEIMSKLDEITFVIHL